MPGKKIWFLLAFVCCFVTTVSAQTDTSVVKVDSVMRGSKEPAPKIDTSYVDTAEVENQPTKEKSEKLNSKPKKEIPKSPERLRLENMPRKAVLRSLIVPGLGQIYNKRWWKVPLVYGGYVGVGLVYEFNQRYYKEFLLEAQYRATHQGERRNAKYVQYDDQAITNAKDFYRRNRDLSILAGLGFHAIQVIDAYVDAKFFRYDIGDELSIKISPSLQPTTVYNAYSPVPSIKIKLSL